MKNTIIIDNKINFKQGETLTFFINENLDFKIENKTFSGKTLNKIQVYLKNLKLKKNKEKIISFDISEKNKVLFIIVKEKFVSNDFEYVLFHFLNYQHYYIMYYLFFVYFN